MQKRLTPSWILNPPQNSAGIGVEDDAATVVVDGGMIVDDDHSHGVGPLCVLRPTFFLTVRLTEQANGDVGFPPDLTQAEHDVPSQTQTGSLDRHEARRFRVRH